VTAVSQALERARIGFDAAAVPRWRTAAILGILGAFSAWLRTRVLGGGFWIDEGISVGIAHHHLTAIPHLLRQDGSPPFYYMLLHVWIGWFGDGERAAHTLSLLFALACIPAAYLIARSLFGRTAGWIGALLATIDPFLSYYAQETRMYTLSALLSIVATGAFVHGVVHGRRRWLPVLVVSLDLLLYTHNWGLFFCAGLVAATAVLAKAHWREGFAAGAVTLLLYAPWLPTLLDQVRHTGAPWALRPGAHALLLSPASVFTGDLAFGAIGLAAGVGLSRRRREPAAMALLLTAGVTILTAWLESQVSSSWTSRYFAVVLGPILLAAATGLARAGRLAVAALAAAVCLWSLPTLHDEKSNVRAVAHRIAPSLRPGDLVLVTHPEQVPVLRYYLGPQVRFATQLGPVPDPRIMNWRDAVERLRAVTVRRDLEPLLASVRPGQRLVIVSPVFRDYHAWQASWTRLVYLTSGRWTRAVGSDPRFRVLKTVRSDEILLERNYWKPLQAVVYVRRR
jgi:mannosyltransferase